MAMATKGAKSSSSGPVKTMNYVGQYKKVIDDVVAACGGSDDKANQLIGELNALYSKALKEIDDLASQYEGDTNSFGYMRDKDKIMQITRHEMDLTIEKYVPNAHDKTHDLFVGASLAIAAATLPFAVPTMGVLTMATGLIAAGGSYFASFNVIKSWPTMSTKANLREMISQSGGKLGSIRISKKK